MGLPRRGSGVTHPAGSAGGQHGRASRFPLISAVQAGCIRGWPAIPPCGRRALRRLGDHRCALGPCVQHHGHARGQAPGRRHALAPHPRGGRSLTHHCLAVTRTRHDRAGRARLPDRRLTMAERWPGAVICEPASCVKYVRSLTTTLPNCCSPDGLRRLGAHRSRARVGAHPGTGNDAPAVNTSNNQPMQKLTTIGMSRARHHRAVEPARRSHRAGVARINSRGNGAGRRNNATATTLIFAAGKTCPGFHRSFIPCPFFSGCLAYRSRSSSCCSCSSTIEEGRDVR